MHQKCTLAIFISTSDFQYILWTRLKPGQYKEELQRAPVHSHSVSETSAMHVTCMSPCIGNMVNGVILHNAHVIKYSSIVHQYSVLIHFKLAYHLRFIFKYVFMRLS